jgi:ribosomal protein S18 acetylase RimI-like enzyme
LNKINTKQAVTSWFLNPFHQEAVTGTTDRVCCEFQIRPATLDDLADVAQIVTESFHSQNGMWGWAFPLLRLGIYEDLRHRLALQGPHHICLVAVDTTPGGTNNLVGTLELGVRFSDSWTQVGRSFPYLSNLAIHPAYRRHGAASGLLKACEKFVREWGFQDLYLHVLENNHQARQLYFKVGYRVCKVESDWNTFLFRHSRQMFLHKHLNSESTL